MDLESKTILVLGGSGVLGSQISQLLISAGSRVLSVASSMQSAERIQAQVNLRLFADLEKQESIKTLSNYLNQEHNLDGIIVASGLVGFGTSLQTSPGQALRLMQVNHLGPAQLIGDLMPKLTQTPNSFIASITGVVAEKSFPGTSAYCASKAAHSFWLSSIRLENKKNGPKVFEFRPGHTETGLASRAIFGVAPNFPVGMQPNYVAQKIVSAIGSNQEILTSADFQG